MKKQIFRNSPSSLVIAVALLFLLVMSSSAFAQLPVLKDKLISVLQKKALTDAEIIAVIESYGVNFKLTSEVESELRSAGASEGLIRAVKGNYRSAAGDETIADEYYEQGVALMHSKDYKKAIKVLEQSVKLNPNNPSTFYIIGEAYYNTRQYTKAVKAYQETLRLNPDQPSAKQDLADAQAKMKEEKAAQEAVWAKLAEGMKNNRSTQPAPPRRNEDNADEETAAPRRGNAQNETGRNRTSPEGAPTEEEVKQAIEKFTREFYDAYNGSKAFISSWDSPIQILSGREDMDNTDPNGNHMMYPVKVDFTITIEGKRTIRYTGGALGFHKNTFGEWKYYTLEDYQKR